MTKDEAITYLQDIGIRFVPTDQYGDYDDPQPYDEALDMAIEALKKPSDAMKLLDDGTLKVKVANVLDIKRVMVMDDNVIYDSYYPDRPKGEWIKATGMMPPEFHGRHCCSECGNFANMEPPFGNREDLSNFCPYCGADMRGDVM